MNITELRAGTRVTTTVGRYAGQSGTVQEGNRGTVTNTEHENYGRAFVSVRWDPTPQNSWGEFFRPFVDELTVVQAALLTLEEALEYADQMRRDTTCVGLPNWPAPATRRLEDVRRQNNTRRAAAGLLVATCVHGNTARPDVTGDPITACANAGGGTEWGAFNDEGCFYSYDCAVDVANHSAQENEDAEATPDDPFSTWGEMCRDHRDQEQPKDGCQECNADEPDDEDDCDEPACEGHYDDGHTLTSGAGIGQPTYCDGSCNTR
jgi:hypothetical protein